MKTYWNRIVLFFSALGAVAFLVSRFFNKSAPGSADAEKFAGDLLKDEKKYLAGEKKELAQEEKAIEKKKYTDDEIEGKFNK